MINPLEIYEFDEDQEPELAFIKDNYAALQFQFNKVIWGCKNQTDCFWNAVVNAWMYFKANPSFNWNSVENKFGFILTVLNRYGYLLVKQCHGCSINLIPEELLTVDEQYRIVFQENNHSSIYEHTEFQNYIELARREVGQENLQLVIDAASGNSSKEVADANGLNNGATARKRKSRTLVKLRKFFAEILN